MGETEARPVGRAAGAGELPPPAIPTEDQAVWNALLELALSDGQREQLFLRYKDLQTQSKDKSQTRENTLRGLGSGDPIKWIQENFYGDWDKKKTPCPDLTPPPRGEKKGREMFGDTYDDLERDYQARRKVLEDSSDWEDLKRLEEFDRNYADAMARCDVKDVRRALSSVPLKDETTGADVPVPTAELTPEAEEKKEKDSFGGKLDKTGEQVDKWAGRVDKGMGWIEKGRKWLGKDEEPPDPSSADAGREKGGMMSRIAQALTSIKNLFKSDDSQANNGSKENSAGKRLADLADPAKRAELKSTKAQTESTLAQAAQAEGQGHLFDEQANTQEHETTIRAIQARRKGISELT